MILYIWYVCAKVLKALRLAKINILISLYSVTGATCPTKRHLGKLLEPQWGKTPITGVHSLSRVEALRYKLVDFTARPKGGFDEDNGAGNELTTEEGNKSLIMWLWCLPSQTLSVPKGVAHTNSALNGKHTELDQQTRLLNSTLKYFQFHHVFI